MEFSYLVYKAKKDSILKNIIPKLTGLSKKIAWSIGHKMMTIRPVGRTVLIAGRCFPLEH